MMNQQRRMGTTTKVLTKKLMSGNCKKKFEPGVPIKDPATLQPSTRIPLSSHRPRSEHDGWPHSSVQWRIALNNTLHQGGVINIQTQCAYQFNFLCLGLSFAQTKKT
eukprot:Lithocolla_globosa_v1_NODE_4766_length_1371_cov_3.313830.p2 type:complete len:107 gc:universal NODE_4766_length_1371_cov_3.313830:962-1282(+)